MAVDIEAMLERQGCVTSWQQPRKTMYGVHGDVFACAVLTPCALHTQASAAAHAGSSTSQATLNAVNGMVGPMILAIPFGQSRSALCVHPTTYNSQHNHWTPGFKLCGWVAAIATMACLGVVFTYTGYEDVVVYSSSRLRLHMPTIQPVSGKVSRSEEATVCSSTDLP